MLGGLGLGTRLVASNQKECGIHNGGSVQHGGHKNVVTGAIDERNVTNQLEATSARWPIAWKAVIFG